MNKEEFTEAFDLERFKAGEPAFSKMSGGICTFICNEKTEHCFRVNIGGNESVEDVKWAVKNWRMKPRSDEGWIKHDGGESPIPWAKAGEFEVKHRSGHIRAGVVGHTYWHHLDQNHLARGTDVIAWRLTDGWVPIIGGKFSFDVKPDTAEFKYKSGVVGRNYFPHRKNGPTFDVVALRLIKQAQPEIKIEHNVPVFWSDDLDEEMPITLAEIRASKPRPDPIRSILRDIEGIMADVRDGRRKRGPVVEYGVIAKLMK